MLIELAVAFASIIPSVLVGGSIAQRVTESQAIVAVLTAAVGASLGFLAFDLLQLSPIVIVGTTIASQTINVMALTVTLYRNRQRRKALDGQYGDITMWAAELVQNGDMEFAFAIDALPKSERMEIGVIAESKEELRRLTMERLDELSDDQIPEDFA